MAASLGSLLYYIKAKNQEFKIKMDENKKKIKEMDDRVQKSKANLKKWGAAITAVSTGILFAFKKMADSSAETAEQLDKLAKQTGISTEELSKLGYAAGQELASIEQLGTGLARLSRNMLDASKGLGEARRAFEELDIQVANADGTLRQTDDVLYEIADRMASMQDETRKTGLAMQIFGRSGAELVPFLSLGSEGIRELGEEAERLGIVLTQDNVEAFRHYKDTLDAVKSGLFGLKMTIANDVLPTLQKLVDRAKALVEWFNGLPDPVRRTVTQLTFFSALVGTIVGPLGLIVGYLPQIMTGLIALQGAFLPFMVGGAIVVGIMTLYNYLFRIRETITGLNKDIIAMDLAQAEEELANTQKRIAELEAEFEKAPKDPRKARYQSLSPMMKGVVDEYNQLLEKEKELIQHISKLRETKEGLGDTTVLLNPEEVEKTADQILQEEMALHRARIKLNQESYEEYKAFLEDKLKMTDKYKTETLAMIQDEIDTIEDKFKRANKRLEELMLSDRPVSAGAITSVMEEYGLSGDLAKRAASEIQNLANQMNQEIASALEEQAQYKEGSKLYEKYEEIIAEIIKKYKRKENQIIYNYLTEETRLRGQKIQEEKAAELRKQKFLLQQREISYYDYLEYLNKQLEAEKEYTDRWYMLIDERQNTLNTIVQNEMQYYKDQSEEMFDNENERINWLIAQLSILKERYADNKVIVHLLNEEIEDLKDNITEPPPPESLNWFEQLFKDMGYKVAEAQNAFESFKNDLVDGLTSAIVKGEDFLETLKRIADQIASMVIKKAFVEPFVGTLFDWAGLGTAHTGALVTTAGLVRDLPSYHSGGKIKPDERIIKVQTGERILSRSQNEAFEAGEFGKKTIEVYNINAVDAKSFQQLLYENKAQIVNIAGEDITSNGLLRKLMKMYGK